MARVIAQSRVDGSLDAWRSHLIVNQNGDPKAILSNVIAALHYAPQWKDAFHYNEFSGEASFRGKKPWPSEYLEQWVQTDDTRLAEWMQREGILVNSAVVAEAVKAVAAEKPFHPVREYLDQLRWDGVRRLDDWLTLYAGADVSSSESNVDLSRQKYVRAVGSRWMISAVARAYQPGVKADCCLILEGPQGLLKSTLLKTLVPNPKFFTDDIEDLGSKDSAMQVRGVWIVELPELDSMSRPEVAKVKAFLSRGIDRFRQPYGRYVIESPRSCVFGGTVNHASYLRDESGNRRFWPVRCTRILLKELERDRDQLWAEAVTRYREGASWWLDSKELVATAETEQSDRLEEDPWHNVIAEWVIFREGDKRGVSVAEILGGPLNKSREHWTQSDRNRVGRCLKVLGWERFNERTGESREWRYRKVTAE